MADEELPITIEKEKREFSEAKISPDKQAVNLIEELAEPPLFGGELREQEIVPPALSLSNKVISAIEATSLKISGFANRVKSIFGQKREKLEQPTPVERLERDLEVAAISEKLARGEATTEKERLAAASMIERRNWGKLLDLKEKDILVSFLVPGGDFLSIKNMNDNIFGYQGTDEIIAYRRQLLGKYLKEAGLEELEQDYLSGFFKIQEKDRPKMEQKLTEISRHLDAEMKVFIGEMVEKIAAKETDPKKIEKIGKFDNLLQKLGYRMTFGISTVGKPASATDFSHVELALNQGLQMAQLSRGRAGEYGGEFSSREINNELKELDALRRRIMDKDNRIVQQLPDGEKFIFDHIFTEQDGHFEINRDILRDVRKYKFKVAEGDKLNEDMLEDVSLYVRKLNLLDIRKPFTHAELSGEENIQGSEISVAAERAEQKELAEKIRSDNYSAEDGKKAAEFLDRDPKDRYCTSKEKFVSGAVKIKNCSYVMLDRLDLGVDLLRSYEQLEQDVLSGKIELGDASVAAGDDTTKAMRDLRQMVREEFGRAFPGEEFLSLVGGDEISLAIDNDRVPQDKIDEFLLTIQSKTRSRVVRSVVTGRSSATATAAKEEHLAALKRTEDGADQLKQIEAEVSKLREKLRDKLREYLLLAEFTPEERRAVEEQTYDKLDGLLEQLSLSHYIMVESGTKLEDGEEKSVFVVKNPSGARNPSEILFRVKRVLKAVPKKDTLSFEEVDQFVGQQT